MVRALNHAVNQAADSLSARSRRHHSDSTNMADDIFYLQFKDSREAIEFDLTNGYVKGFDSIQGANGNRLYVGDNGDIYMTVNLKFNKLLLGYDYNTPINTNFNPRFGYVKVLAFNTKISVAVRLGIDVDGRNTEVSVNGMSIKGSIPGKSELHFNGRNFHDNQFAYKNVLINFGQYAGVLGQQFVLQNKNYLSQKLEQNLRNSKVVVQALKEYYQYHE